MYRICTTKRDYIIQLFFFFFVGKTAQEFDLDLSTTEKANNIKMCLQEAASEIDNLMVTKTKRVTTTFTTYDIVAVLLQERHERDKELKEKEKKNNDSVQELTDKRRTRSMTKNSRAAESEPPVKQLARTKKLVSKEEGIKLTRTSIKRTRAVESEHATKQLPSTQRTVGKEQTREKSVISIKR